MTIFDFIKQIENMENAKIIFKWWIIASLDGSYKYNSLRTKII